MAFSALYAWAQLGAVVARASATACAVSERCLPHAPRPPHSYEGWQAARRFRRDAQAAAAADARTLFRKESDWMMRQPKARQAKSSARVRQFYEVC